MTFKSRTLKAANTRLAARIRIAMAARGYNAKQLAEFCGVSNTTISKWTRGLNFPASDLRLMDICRALDVSFTWLTCDDPIILDDPSKPI